MIWCAKRWGLSVLLGPLRACPLCCTRNPQSFTVPRWTSGPSHADAYGVLKVLEALVANNIYHEVCFRDLALAVSRGERPELAGLDYHLRQL
jgi:hypothetical protein